MEEISKVMRSNRQDMLGQQRLLERMVEQRLKEFVPEFLFEV